MTKDKIIELLSEIDGNTEIFVCNDIDGALLWRMPWVYILSDNPKIRPELEEKLTFHKRDQ